MCLQSVILSMKCADVGIVQEILRLMVGLPGLEELHCYEKDSHTLKTKVETYYKEYLSAGERIVM